MKMSWVILGNNMALRKIYWASQAELTYAQNLEYLSKRWNAKVISDFFDITDDMLTKIAKNPSLFPIYDKQSNIRYCVLHKAITIYFKDSDDDIYLITFWNTYQNPDALLL